MEKINRSVKRYFWWALGLSVGFPLGVLAIVFGAIKMQLFLLVPGIILAVAGFYVMPILWVKFAERKKYKHILDMIINQHILTVGQLANNTGMRHDEIRKIVNYLFLANYLVNFVFHNDSLEPVKPISAQKNALSKKCPDCGSTIKKIGKIFKCEYCGYLSEE